MSWTNTACWRSVSCWNAPGEPRQRQQRARVERGRVRRDDRQDRLDEAGHVDHQLAVFLVRLGVARRPAAQLAHRPAVVVDTPQVVPTALRRAVAGMQRGEGPVERQDVEAVLRELEVADDLGPQERHDVREHAEAEAREELLGDSGASEDGPLFEHERLQAGAREVRRAHETVVAAADDDRVVALGQPAPSPIQPAYVSCSVPERQPAGAVHTRRHERRHGLPSADRGPEPQDAVAGVVRLLRVLGLRRLPRHRVQRDPRGRRADRRVAAVQVSSAAAAMRRVSSTVSSPATRPA